MLIIKVQKDFVVESIEGEGNPVDLEQSTLFQDELSVTSIIQKHMLLLLQ